MLRNLKDASNADVPPPLRSRACKGDLRDITDPELLFRCNQLERQGLPGPRAATASRRTTLYMAWDFTVASQESLTGRMTDDPR